MSWARMGDGRYFYLERGPAGAARQVLFVHGSGGTCRHWARQLDLPGARVYAVDLPGHGRSEGSPANRVEVYAEFVYRLAGALGLSDFVLGGHSLGGAIALEFARRHPEQLAGLILVGTGARLKVNPTILEAFGSGRAYPELADWAYSPDAAVLRERARREEVDPAVSFADFSACNAFDMMDDLSRIDVPALVLVGTGDRLTPPKYAAYLARHLPRAGLVTFEGAGHMLMLEKPDEVNQAVAGFLAACG